ncbi:MAG: ATP-binding protein [Lentihominibacter sp.]
MNRKNGIVAAVCIVLILSACMFYVQLVQRSIYKESSVHLQELYGQVNETFTSLVERNWNLLRDWEPYIRDQIARGNDKNVENYIDNGRNSWGFTEFYFINSDGSCMNSQGTYGYLNFGSGFVTLIRDQENVVLDATFPSREPFTVFAVPVEKGEYKGFTYSAIAVGYEKKRMEDILSINAFDNTANCQIVYPDGRVIFAVSSEVDHPYNYFSYLEDNAQFENTGTAQIKDNLAQGKSGTARYSLKGMKYYLVYEPVGFQDWILLGITPASVVNYSINQVQWFTIMIIGFIFIMLILMAVYYILQHSRSKIKEKDEELRYRQQMFNMLVNNTSEIFVMISASDDYSVEYISPNMEKLLGIPEDELYSDIHRLNQEIPGYDWDELRKELDRLPLNETLHQSHQRLNEKTGEVRWYNETLYYLTIDGQEKLLLVMTDQTEERKRRSQLEQALDLARSATQAKSDFLANMSHDIRTPMNAVIGFAGLLERNADNPSKVRDYITKITASGQHMQSLINDILDMSRIENGKMTLNENVFSLDELLEEVDAVIQPQVMARQQIFAISSDEITQDVYIGDSARIRQILLNLLTNAVKYTPERGRIRLSVSETDRLTDDFVGLCFKVSDTGIGISEEYIDKIFDPFSRERNSTVSGIQGTGLGMSITRSLVELMGGSISAESRLGEGSVFTVSLHLRCGQAPDISQDENGESSDSLEGMNILIAEDTPMNMDIILDLLEMYGARCITAVNGREALEKFEASSPGDIHIVLMDIQMPVMNGYEASERIRNCSHPDAHIIPIIAMTANAFADDIQKCLDAGMDAHIAKPLNIVKLNKMIHEYVSLFMIRRNDPELRP